MRIAQHTIFIERSPDAVFDYFVDFTRAAEWRQYVESITPRGPVGAGSKLLAVLNIMGERQQYEMTVLACRRPSLWRHRTDETDFHGYVEYRFEPEGAGTRVTMTMQAKPVTFYGWLAVPILWLPRHQPYSEQLPHLKRALEA